MLKNKVFKAVCVVLVLMIAFDSVGCNESAKADGGQAKKAVHKKVKTKAKAKLVKATMNFNKKTFLLPKLLFETKETIAMYTQYGVYFYDKTKKRIVKGFMVKVKKHPLHLNGQGSELAWAVANKKHTAITIFTVGAGFLKYINKEYYVYNIKTGKLKIVKKSYPRKKIKQFYKKAEKQQMKGWVDEDTYLIPLKKVKYKSRIDGKLYKPFSKE